MTNVAERRVGRPPKTSREQILDAAAFLSPAELQMTALARQLHVSVQTIYYYFPSRRALLDALTERAVDQLSLPDVATPATWRDVLTEAARWAYGVGLSHPGWYFGTAPPVGVGVRALVLILDRLAELGAADVQAFNAWSVVGNWAAAAGEAARRTLDMGGLSAENVNQVVADYGDPEEVLRLQGLFSDVDLDDHFRTGLAIVLDGVERYFEDVPLSGY